MTEEYTRQHLESNQYEISYQMKPFDYSFEDPEGGTGVFVTGWPKAKPESDWFVKFYADRYIESTPTTLGREYRDIRVLGQTTVNKTLIEYGTRRLGEAEARRSQLQEALREAQAATKAMECEAVFGAAEVVADALCTFMLLEVAREDGAAWDFLADGIDDSRPWSALIKLAAAGLIEPDELGVRATDRGKLLLQILERCLPGGSEPSDVQG